MTVTVHPSSVKGTITAPPSKSSMQRACAAALITHGTTIIANAGNSNDENAALNIIRQLGASVKREGNKITVVSNDHIYQYKDTRKNVVVDCGESGLSMRMFSPIGGLFNYDIVFTGTGSLTKRPMDFLEKYLPRLQIEVKSNDGKIPVTVRGPVHPKEITVDGSLSSQYLTGLLFLFAKAAKKPVTIKVKELQSRPYIDLTIAVLKHFGFEIINNDYKSFGIIPQKTPPLTAIKYTVEGDWSNVAFLLVAGAIKGPVILKGADMHSFQGDKKILDALYAAEADVVIHKKEIHVNGGDLKSFTFDATHCPDLFPPLVALASYCNGVSSISGVFRLLHKESDRAMTLKKEFGKMGVEIELNGDIMKIHGNKKLKGAKVDSHNDHRIAMACAIAALGAKGKTAISHAEAVNKSYPEFFKDLKSLGAIIG